MKKKTLIGLVVGAFLTLFPFLSSQAQTVFYYVTEPVLTGAGPAGPNKTLRWTLPANMVNRQGQVKLQYEGRPSVWEELNNDFYVLNVRFYVPSEGPRGEPSKRYLMPDRIRIRDARGARGGFTGLECEPDDAIAWDYPVMDTCLHPTKTAEKGMTITRFHSQAPNNEFLVFDAEFDGTADPINPTREQANIEFVVFRVAPGINDQPDYQIKPEAIDLGQMLAGERKGDSFLIENVGWGDLNLTDIALTGPHSSDFRMTFQHHSSPRRNTVPFILGMGGRVRVTIEATGAGNPEPLRWATLKVEGTYGKQKLPAAQAPIVYTPVKSYEVELVLSHQEFYFFADQRNPAQGRTVMLIDRSGGATTRNSLLQISSIRVTGPDASYFKVTTRTPTGLRTPVRVEYMAPPPVAGQLIRHQAELEIVSNSIDNRSSVGGVAKVRLDAYTDGRTAPPARPRLKSPITGGA